MRHRERKNVLAALLAACLLLTGCGGGPRPFDLEETAAALLDSGAFSVELEELPAQLLYDFEGYGLSEGAVTEARAYSASGLTEQVGILLCRDEDGAAEAAALLEEYLADARETFRNYAPAEVGKLENAILEVRENTVLLVVAGDVQAARKAIDGLK